MVILLEDRSPELEAEYRRLVISYFDFHEAAQFLNELKALGPVDIQEPHSVSELRRALTIASIVAYARPFTRNNGASTAPKIRIADVEGLSAEERDLHEIVMSRRHGAIAHSDAEVAALHYQLDHPNGPVPHVKDSRVAFTLFQAETFHALAAKLSTWSASRALRLTGVPLIGGYRAAPGDV